ncbi:hypothetical protein H5968_22950 [Sphaerospermopsis sp. LEGE 00249]|uniref:hypothetical protein n=1 Tax=Sphaerospermopsis sp. LEGE 00249 TaxID=1380707 RepID=UPI00164E116D|nr:hypothetical protein [Sphaerospermopsis sp. LEGE 00249]MBC5797928.1 hypothetical protein [Sphaerospermopsis sp. LEGE 00249]
MLYSYYSLGPVYYLFTAYTERAFLHPFRLFKHPLRAKHSGNQLSILITGYFPNASPLRLLTPIPN